MGTVDIKEKILLEQFTPEFVEAQRHGTLFNAVISAMVNGTSPFTVIESLVKSCVTMEHTISDVTKNAANPQIIVINNPEMLGKSQEELQEWIQSGKPFFTIQPKVDDDQSEK